MEMDDGYWESLLKDVDQQVEIQASRSEAENTACCPEARCNGRTRSWSGPQEEDEADWLRAEEMLSSGETFAIEISGYNRGGLLADFGTIQGFLPASHLICPPMVQDPGQRQSAMASMIGIPMVVRVVEIDRDRCRLILSERLARETGREDEVLAGLVPGQVRHGRVTNLCPFGAFVDLGGFEGLIHISELSWGRVGAPDEVLKPGEEVDLLVLEVHADERKVSLSLKRLCPDPWCGVQDRYHSGQIVDAVITNVVSFGAFARLEAGLEGLVHVSELSEGTFMHPRNVVNEGDRIRARVIQVDEAKRRIALSMRGLELSARPAGSELHSGVGLVL